MNWLKKLFNAIFGRKKRAELPAPIKTLPPIPVSSAPFDPSDYTTGFYANSNYERSGPTRAFVIDLRNFIVNALTNYPELFDVNNSQHDIFSYLKDELGLSSDNSINNRAACMFELMRISAAMESSYNWTEDRDKSANNKSWYTREAGIFQTSPNSHVTYKDGSYPRFEYADELMTKNGIGKVGSKGEGLDNSEKWNAFMRDKRNMNVIFQHHAFMLRNNYVHYGPMVRKWQVGVNISRKTISNFKNHLDEMDFNADDLPVFEPDRPKQNVPGLKKLWIPHAIQPSTKMKTKGNFKYGYPQGMIVHWHSGWSTKSQNWGKKENKNIDIGARNGFNYLVLDRGGYLYQTTPLNKWGYHAGRSSWRGLSGTVSNELIGVEVEAAGTLTKSGSKFRSWFGQLISKNDTRTARTKDNARAGTYHKYTEAQEAALISLCLWLKANNPDVFDLDLVLGHDEVSPGRKTDPGHALSMTMPEFRRLLKREYEKTK